MTPSLYIDLETRSQCDLTFHGLRRYAVDPSTEVICMAYCFDDGPMRFWWSDEAFPAEVSEHFVSGGAVWAHNAQFEQDLFEFVICDDYDIEPPAPEQWRCSMAVALANGHPAQLGQLGEALGLRVQKQAHGTRLIREYCAPGFLTAFKDGDANLMQEYCEHDVLVMREALKLMRPLTDDEWAEYHLNQRINDRGLPVDVDFCNAAIGYSREIQDDANRQLAEITGGLMTKHTQRKGRDEWLLPRLTDEQMKLITVYKKGEKKISLDQDHRGYLLDCEDLDGEARELLEAIDAGGSSALKKFAVAAHCHVGGRVHHTFLWHGAQTGRFSGRGLQPHNMRRDCFGANEAEALIADVIEGYQIDRPATTMARLLRPMIRSEAGVYYVDWSSIEGRVAPWLSASASGERKLDIFRADKDVYVVTAADMFGKAEADVDKDLRQSGKIAELSLGFGGGRGALIGMAKNYGVTFADDEAQEIVERWRSVNRWGPEIWSDFERAAARAVKNPGTSYTAGRVTFQADDGMYLWAMLPCGRLLAYPFPRMEDYETPWGEIRFGATFQTSIKPSPGEPRIRRNLRGALLFQNCVQGVAASILRRALVKADAAGLKVILHCHDEIVGEGSYEDGERLNAIMLDLPPWAEGLPLATGGVEWGKRYGK